MIVEAIALPVFAILLLEPTLTLEVSAKIALFLLLADIGIAFIGTLVAALAIRTRARDLIVPLIALPLLIPVVIGAAQGLEPLLAAAGTQALEGRWLAVLCLYDLVFGLLAYAVFDYLLED
jgi:heme exporter protein B